MRAAVVAEGGLVVKEVPDPRPGPRQVLVRLRAIGLNRADLGVASGHKHGNQGGPGAIPGIEGAGEVVEVGSEVPSHIVPGMRVMASMSGSYAEYCAVDWDRLFPVPSNNMSWEVAATLPLALQTMHDAVVTHGLCGPGRSILIQGASSGVGLMGLQVARLMGATTVIGTSTNAERRARLTEFGATHAVDTSDTRWVDQVLEATGGRGVDAVVDMISGPLVSQTLRATAILGRIVNVGRLGGTVAEFDFDTHAARRITYVGVTFRTRSAEEVAEIVRRSRTDLWGALEAGKLSLPLDRTYALDEVNEALAQMKANQHFGKLALIP
ncbi:MULTISPECIES: quinone oxidoreductase family protein [Roseomonadaceae]|uniref:Zinc-binding dehydrogenase n=1 Tax=Falsiroseomonas oleicola TaxID=2801474 RepID=A0ABS6HBS4_9PROT|nr:zinc-binding dehydrogenase [Roseomonas oleicola]MBU8546138.1 zinc-binding dehydrogenase [Roseomonas oleicola]